MLLIIFSEFIILCQVISTISVLEILYYPQDSARDAFLCHGLPVSGLNKVGRGEFSPSGKAINLFSPALELLC